MAFRALGSATGQATTIEEARGVVTAAQGIPGPGDFRPSTRPLPYAQIDFPAQDESRRRAATVDRLWRSARGRTSFQVLQEFYVTVTRKLKPGMDPAAARADVRSSLAWHPSPTNPAVIEGAWSIQDRYGLAWWDALIVSAAQVADCWA